MEIILIADVEIFLYPHSINSYDISKNLIENRNEFLGFWRLTESKGFLMGELLRDEQHRPIIFKNINEIKPYAQKVLPGRLRDIGLIVD